MRYYSWKAELLRVAIPLLVVAAGCALFDLGLLPLLAAALLACAWLLRHLQRLSDWLYNVRSQIHQRLQGCGVKLLM
jgi:hypothetical protein